MVSTAEVSQVLAGLDFPATKQQMIDYAKSKNARPEVIKTLENLKSERFDTMAQVWHEVGMVA